MLGLKMLNDPSDIGYRSTLKEQLQAEVTWKPQKHKEFLCKVYETLSQKVQIH